MRRLIKNYLKKARKEMDQEFTSELSAPPSPEVAPWIGFALDGTLAIQDDQDMQTAIGPPVPEMVQLARKMIDAGIRVKVLTARASDPKQYQALSSWLKENGLDPAEITNVKDYYMQRIYDAKCIQVEKNTGRLIGSHSIAEQEFTG